MVPTHNSLLVAGLALYLALEDGEAGAEVYCAAAKMGQAKIIWNDCVTQLKRIDPDEERAERYQHSIALPGGGFLKPISADADTEDGMNPSAALIDELHRQPDDRLVNVMRQSTAARSQPVVIMLTTADEDRESVCNETLERAKQVRDNPGDATRPGFDPKFLPVIYEADPKDDWTSPDMWRKANPNLGVSVSPEFLADSCRNAKDNPSLLPDFLRYHLNVRARGGARKLFPDMTLWDACGAAFDVETLKGKDCVVGVDLSSTTDITALVAVFPESMHVLAWFWVPEDAAKKRDVRNDRIYTTWAAAGLLTLTEGNQIDEARVLDEMLLNLAPYKVREVGIDPWNSVRYTQPMMERGLPVVAVRQGWVTLSEPTKYLSTLVGNVQTPGRPHLKHGGNPVLRWMAGNAELDVDKKGNWSLTKPNGGAKIDGIAALATAFARVVVAPKPPPQYDPVVV
jgi:phage terminase large subunit-like protein